MALSIFAPRLSRSSLIRSYSTNSPDPRFHLKIDHVSSPKEITRDLVNQRITSQGYAFFRGAGITDSKKLKELQPALFERDVYDYHKLGGIYSETRKDRVEGVYDFVNVSTPFWDMPAHNDLSYRPSMVERVVIAQYLPSLEGGCTPLYDTRLVWNELIEKFRDVMIDLHKYGLLYTKNLPDKNNTEKSKQWMETADISAWQTTYPNMSKQQIQNILEKNGETVVWKEDGTLQQTWYITAFRNHPKTGERFFCNQLLGFEGRNYWQWPGRIFDSLPLMERPTHARIGNGKDLTDEEYIGIVDIHKKYAMRTPWHTGDVVIFDNVWFSHGRDPYKGDRHLAIMWGDTLPAENVK